MGELRAAGYASDVLSVGREGRESASCVGCGLTGSVLLKEEAVEQARWLGRNVVEQALREEKRFVGSMMGRVCSVI